MPKQPHWLPSNLASAVFVWSLEPDAGTAEHRANAWRSMASCFRRRDGHTALRPIRQSMIPYNGSGTMISDNGFAAMVADNGWLSIVPNHHGHAVTAHVCSAGTLQLAPLFPAFPTTCRKSTQALVADMNSSFDVVRLSLMEHDPTTNSISNSHWERAGPTIRTPTCSIQ
jgi:hypothetical protein